jgi:hypothetical protein
MLTKLIAALFKILKILSTFIKQIFMSTISNIIKGKIQHDKTFAAAAAIATAINFKKKFIRARLPN